MGLGRRNEFGFGFKYRPSGNEVELEATASPAAMDGGGVEVEEWGMKRRVIETSKYEGGRELI